jgi:hypothetical protein
VGAWPCRVPTNSMAVELGIHAQFAQEASSVWLTHNLTKARQARIGETQSPGSGCMQSETRRTHWDS